MVRLVQVDRKMTVTTHNITKHNTSNLEEIGLQQQKTKPGSPPVSQEKETEVTVGAGSPKLDSRQKMGKRFSGLMNLDFCQGKQMVGSEFCINNMNPWIHPALCHQFRLLGVGWCGACFL